jgi:O-antigen ligase
LTLAAIVYASWHLGAADTTALRNLSLLLSAALVLTLCCPRTYQVPSHRLPISLFTLMLAWIAYASLQQTAIASWLPSLFEGIVEVRQRWGVEPIALLAQASEQLGVPAAATPLLGSASVLPEESRQSLVPFQLGAAAAVLSAILFHTPVARQWFLGTVIANASLLAIWGIIQKAGGGEQILPGLPNTYSSGPPFASFIYKNAGAAALLPALAAIGAILYRQGATRARARTNQFGRTPSPPAILDPKHLSLILLAALLVAGLAASLSRGAWLAAAAAAVVVALLSRPAFSRRRNLVAVAVSALAMLAVVGLTGVRDQIRGRTDQVSLEVVTSDQRWSQWIDGFAAARAHWPSGSGLGTYGYASLVHQSEPRRSWFREAHNQYLEVLTESGLVGIVVLLAGMAWLARVSWRLFREGQDRERRSWGLLGIALLVCGGVQSLFDFVLVIPANLILYASLIALIGSIACDASVLVMPRAVSPPSRSRWPRWLPPAAVSAAAVLLLVLAAHQAKSGQLGSQQALASASVDQIAARPSRDLVERTIGRLGAAIQDQPHNPAIYYRRADWHLASYRLVLMEEARRQGATLRWEDTRPETIHAALTSGGGPQREALRRELLATAPLRDELARAIADLSAALSLDPLSPRVHLTCCVLSPLTGMPSTAWIESSSQLVNNSAEMLYLNGLFAFQCDRLDLAVDQWSKSLAIGPQYLDAILEQSLQKLPLIRVATDLVPGDRPELMLRLLRQSGRGESGELQHDRQLGIELVALLEHSTSAEAGLKHATIARIRALLGDHDLAVLSWQAALRADSLDPGYRLEYSQSLRRVGRIDEALKQAVLGKTLNPMDDRFERLASSIRQELRLGKRR